MIHLTTKTGYSSRYGYGSIDDIAEFGTIALADIHNTFSHYQASKKIQNPVFGVSVLAVADIANRIKKQTCSLVTMLAKNNDGLREIYKSVSLATNEESFYHTPRIQLTEFSDNIIYIFESLELANSFLPHYNVFMALSPASMFNPELSVHPLVATSCNRYIREDQKSNWQISMCDLGASNSTFPLHLLSDDEWLSYYPDYKRCLDLTHIIADSCHCKMDKADILKPDVSECLHSLCIKGFKLRKQEPTDEYIDRALKEIEIIESKNFTDYFHIVYDLVQYARQHMVVGVGRGSAGGSLVCYLLGITDIDPIKYGCLFERFIDTYRDDYPDIDIDFQDNKRFMVLDYLKGKYGDDRVAKLGTVSFWKPKSIYVAAERSYRSQYTNERMLVESGEEFASVSPEFSEIEGKPSHFGQHAAGVILTSEPILNYCSINGRTDNIQLDKNDAEDMGMLKVDVLGLSTLSIIEDCLLQVNLTWEDLLYVDREDQKAFDVLNEKKFCGIFQFSGKSLQGVCKKMTKIDKFEDLVSLTSLGRPAAMEAGGTTEWIERRNGNKPIVYDCELVKPILEPTMGIITYQEQVMKIAKDIGNLSWKDVGILRKMVSKSKGADLINEHFYEKFKSGCEQNGLTTEEMEGLWTGIKTMGGYGFNRSHAVAYSLLSYFCLWLKAYYPLEFLVSCLRSSNDNEATRKMLREALGEGYDYEPFNALYSMENWTIKNGKLIGGLESIKGIGKRVSQAIIKKRNEGKSQSPHHKKLLTSGETPWDSLYPMQAKFQHIFDDPRKYNIITPITDAEDLTDETDGDALLFGKLESFEIRDSNAPDKVKKRGHEVDGPSLYLVLRVTDDTGTYYAVMNRMDFSQQRESLRCLLQVGYHYLLKGTTTLGASCLWLDRVACIEKTKRLLTP